MNQKEAKTTDGPKCELQTEHMQRLEIHSTEHVRQKQRLVFYTGGKSDSAPDNEYDQDKQMKYRNNNDSQNESEV